MRDKIYGLGRDEVLGRIKKLADSYTPEWKFDTKNPDAGSAIGMIFAEQTIDNLEMLHLLFENYHREFVNLFGISLKPASPGFGAAFISGEGASSIPVLKGTSLVGEDVFGDEIVFETLHDLFAVNAELCSVIFCSPRKDKKIPFRGSFLTMAYACKQQLFWDGNKRTSTMVASKILIENGEGILTIGKDNAEEFNVTLNNWYLKNELQPLKDCLRKCIRTLEI